MPPSDDYYGQLGVGRDASSEAIRSAYRRLARQYHPDVNPGDDGASRRFARIRAAYDVLSDPDKRTTYDRTGRIDEAGSYPPPNRATATTAATTPPKPSVGLWGRLATILGGGGGRGADLRQPMELDLSDAINGATVPVVVRRSIVCAACGGTGRDPRGASGPCSSCGAAATETIRVRVPPGIAAGGVVRVAGKGLPARAGGSPGDLYLVAEIRPHAGLRPIGRDLHSSATISVWTAMSGGHLEVPTLDGVATIRIPAGSQHGQRFRLRGKGGRDFIGGELGDQIVELAVNIPALGDERLAQLIDGLRAIAEDTATFAAESEE